MLKNIEENGYLYGSHLRWQELPCQPGEQLHSPETGSQVALFKQGHLFSHRGPHVPGGQAEIKKFN